MVTFSWKERLDKSFFFFFCNCKKPVLLCTTALYKHGLCKHKWCNHRLPQQDKGSVYTVLYFCYHGFILWCHDKGIGCLHRGLMWHRCWRRVFIFVFVYLCLGWLCGGVGGQLIWKSCRDLIYFVWGGSGLFTHKREKRYTPKRLKQRHTHSSHTYRDIEAPA